MSEKTKRIGRRRQNLRARLVEVNEELKASVLTDIQAGESEMSVAKDAQIDRAKTLRPWIGKGR